MTFNPAVSPGSCTDPTAAGGTCLYTIMGGGYKTEVEAGASCDADFFTVDSDFRLLDVGFRCCIDQNPGLTGPSNWSSTLRCRAELAFCMLREGTAKHLNLL